MSVRTVLAATYRLFKGVDNDRAGTPPDRGATGGAAPDRFERSSPPQSGGGGRAMGDADSGGGDTKGGTHIGF
ncbi:MAG TPA: hypothetical protein VND93_34210 [Myxococcales bacterium]|nr:hypothetical protein [Myxococcales bacterium]